LKQFRGTGSTQVLLSLGTSTNDTVTNSEQIASYGKAIMNIKLRATDGCFGVIIYIIVLSRYFAGGKEKNHEQIQRGYWILDRGLKPVLAEYEAELNSGCISTLTF
jgi:hypothetical protein